MTDYVGGSARELTPDEVAEIERLTRELEQAFLDRHADGFGLTERERREVERMAAETRRAIELDVRAQPRIVTNFTTDSSYEICGRTSYVDPGREPQIERENREASEALSMSCCDISDKCPPTFDAGDESKWLQAQFLRKLQGDEALIRERAEFERAAAARQKRQKRYRRHDWCRRNWLVFLILWAVCWVISLFAYSGH